MSTPHEGNMTPDEREAHLRATVGRLGGPDCQCVACFLLARLDEARTKAAHLRHQLAQNGITVTFASDIDDSPPTPGYGYRTLDPTPRTETFDVHVGPPNYLLPCGHRTIMAGCNVCDPGPSGEANRMRRALNTPTPPNPDGDRSVPASRVRADGLVIPSLDACTPSTECTLHTVCRHHELTRAKGCTCHGPRFRSSSCQVSFPDRLGHAVYAAAHPDSDPAALD